ncbi:hypothetical protein A3C21_04200 [Candidatus Kaiserbacteria bacterium RIFCSPHIGHO2_02_FULL_59_21]|uniref:Uncharacterized protein n=1 Tax=Candidatus Kaiserbacteria bacterium RIFCSPHIGHO2_02_FULL_59_21 TaxID=1798500 RepID=A0A1F6E003_9BACT|nr:MAG: hypothetical protein A2766_01675 [Candidatus Kaiserbacteria bacterium RIFCSPHIGHO2_01_FULL_58_22]OGG67001.1 MAG: hypothetical protein A3C21_04200 [Candidatus Kaiserbacteria bacterium RIFCSPHIGHO2_02_FULL_59_21]OGG78890.1 MAG: hypothetical protein A2952_00845 [Candidatus Kaiserbacteria bacterium RIFCSPLOWO2_01_FULL_59_34]OGG85963.1 MAG: hypothetical protein A3I47_01600 [Candidatus Kaiserbacteria bacterium RIFCSPLOWO2_02_FULL_59_19]
MSGKNARFYFANLGADVLRCIVAAEAGDRARYESSIGRAQKTLEALRTANRPEAYEEGLLLLRAVEYARADGTLEKLRVAVNRLVTPFVVAA